MVAWLHDAAPQAELGESYACDVAQQPCEPTASRQDATRTFFEGALNHSSGAGYLGG